MALPGIQQEYGGFDPRYLGVTLRFGNSRTWDLWNSDGALHPSVVLAKPRDEAFESMSLATVVTHETRHFHDFLLTPYGNLLFRYRLMALLNGSVVLSEIRQRSTREQWNCVPVPISVWCRKGPEERERTVRQWNALPGGRVWRPVQLPFLTGETAADLTPVASAGPDDEFFTRALMETMRNYGCIDELVRNPRTEGRGVPYQPCHILELSGIIVHIQAVANLYGEEAVRLFQEVLSEDSGIPYLVILRGLAELCRQANRPIDCRQMNEVMIWSLLGNHELDGWRACPTVRFSYLYNSWKETGLPRDQKTVMEIFEEWSERAGMATVRSSLSRTLEHNRRLVDQLDRQLTERKEYAKFFAGGPTNCLHAWLKATEHTINSFLSDPEAYTWPDEYLENLGAFVNPPVRYQFDGGAIPGTKQYFEERGYQVYRAGAVDDHQLLVQSMSPPMSMNGLSFIDRDDAYWLFDWMAVIDVLFAQAGRGDWELNVVPAMMEREHGLRPLLLLE